MSKADERSNLFCISSDVLNTIACIGVIALHHNGLVHTYDGGTSGWVQSLVVECLCYCSVPLFIMLSGANLLGYKERYSTTVFFKKRFIRTVIPWLFWSVVFLIWNLKTGMLKLEPLNGFTILDVILNNKVMSVYWFFGSLFGCYLVMPILSSLRNERKTLWYLAGISFVFFSCKPILSRWLQVNWSIDIPMGGGLVIFVLLGYLLTTQTLSRKQRIWLYILGFAGLSFRFFYTWYWSVRTGITDTSIKGYVYFHSVLYALAVFVFFNRIDWRKTLPEWLVKRIHSISACSFGIFLIHRKVMEYESQWLGIGNRQWTWRILCIPLTYLVCLGIVALIRKIPWIKYTVGG